MYPFPTLPDSLAREIFADLCATLPPPLDDSAESRDARDIMAMEAVAALAPADAAEAMLAVQAVVAEAHARDCLRLANQYRSDMATAIRCRAQAAAMMRQMHRALRALRQTQALRPPIEAIRAADSIPLPDQQVRQQRVAQAEDYAMMNPLAAARLRRRSEPTRTVLATLGPDAAPPDPTILDTLIHSRSPVLCALDNIAQRWAAAA